MPELTAEMRSFFLHREVSLSLVDMAHLYARGERPTFVELVNWVALRRGMPDELLERTALILAHLEHCTPGDDGVQADDVEAWFAAAEPIAVVFTLGAAAARAAHFAADQAQAHANNLKGANP
jgi:hypothetical protein